MTATEKAKIAELQASGLGYRRIAAELNLSINTVKSFCRSHPVAQMPQCEQCGKRITQTPHKRKRRFCSDQCRMHWWKSHPGLIRRTVLYPHVCLQCGMPYESHRASSKFCSRRCYAEARRKEAL